MGEARRKNAYFRECLAHFECLGNSELPEATHQAAAEALCESVGRKFLRMDFELLEPTYHRVLADGTDQAFAGMTRFLDEFLSVIWPPEHIEGHTLMVGIPCQVLPEQGDVIGSFDSTEPLAALLAQALELPREAITVGEDLFDFPAYEGCLPVLLSALPMKLRPSPDAAKRVCVRFEEGPAATAVTRLLMARVDFPDAEALGRCYERVANVVEMPAELVMLPYTLRQVMTGESATCQAAVRPLAVALPYTAMRKWAFHEGRVELDEALEAVKAREALEDSDLAIAVAIVGQPPLEMPGALPGSSGEMGESDPQVHVVVARADTEETLADVLYGRWSPRVCGYAVADVLGYLAGRPFAMLGVAEGR